MILNSVRRCCVRGDMAIFGSFQKDGGNCKDSRHYIESYGVYLTVYIRLYAYTFYVFFWKKCIKTYGVYVFNEACDITTLTL